MYKITPMDIAAKIKELTEKQADCEKRIDDLKAIKKELGTQIRKLQTIDRHANEVLNDKERDLSAVEGAK